MAVMGVPVPAFGSAGAAPGRLDEGKASSPISAPPKIENLLRDRLTRIAQLEEVESESRSLALVLASHAAQVYILGTTI